MIPSEGASFPEKLSLRVRGVWLWPGGGGRPGRPSIVRPRIVRPRIGRPSVRAARAARPPVSPRPGGAPVAVGFHS